MKPKIIKAKEGRKTSEILVLGGRDTFRRLLGSDAADAADAAAEYYPLVAAMPRCPLPQYLLRCNVLLLWNEEAERLLPHIYADSVVSCGFAACCTLTLSSMEQSRAVLAVQREFRRLDGSAVPPQDIPLKEWWYGITPEEQIMFAGLRLLRGEM